MKKPTKVLVLVSVTTILILTSIESPQMFPYVQIEPSKCNGLWYADFIFQYDMCVIDWMFMSEWRMNCKVRQCNQTAEQTHYNHTQPRVFHVSCFPLLCIYCYVVLNVVANEGTHPTERRRFSRARVFPRGGVKTSSSGAEAQKVVRVPRCTNAYAPTYASEWV